MNEITELNLEELDRVSGGGPVETAQRVLNAVGNTVVGLIGAGLGFLGSGGAIGGSSSGGGCNGTNGCYPL